MLIEKAHNAYDVGADWYHCFGCSKSNDKGLKLDFFRHDGKVFSCWDPDRDLQGYRDILHGGVMATLLDEVSAWFVYLIAETSGLTSRLTVRYHRSAPVNQGKLFLRASEISRRRNLVLIKAELFAHDMTLCASGEVEFFTFPEEKAIADMNYPGAATFAGEMVDSRDFGFPDQLFEAVA
jgi:acyl-coenzyme A thioesterase PaaI-like protein